MLQAPTISDREPVKRDFYDLDKLIGDLSQPKEQIISSPTAGTGLNNAPGSVPGFDNEAPEPIPAEIAALSGKIIANTIDTTLSTGMSLYSKTNQVEKYEASDKQMQNLQLAWAAVAQKYNYRVEDSPWFNVALLNVAVYFPKWQEAANDRRFAQMDERFREMEQKLKENKARLDLIETKPGA